ncbi:ROK family transcriptional regulator [Cellulomonas xylanilytica]|uniref:Transcriptional regulator n=1 Tax=Cellulomonas xylanilytica TaxID=233583 RepID=A0A510VDL5_9CELL|nr:ROK family transcriptional regulator [Cellulomonas xylanilytica]GEK23300.1 transcriptional regulator [Cellulomonas xylanilytica]
MAQVPVSSRHLREASARLVLEHLWDAAEVTGSALIDATGLSRATVHGVCDELIDQGWVIELESLRAADRRNGRPARRYAFDARAGVVVGVDAGQHRVSATVADLQGVTLARAVLPVSASDGTTARRLALIEDAMLAALADADTGPRRVLAVAVGVPAPVDRDGRTYFQDNPFWELMNPDIALHLRERHGWTVLTDNDANLAAVAEHWRGHGRGTLCHVTLLAGERFGAGVVDDGRLLRGAHGGVGEMRYLDVVEGVGSALGIAALLRDDAREQLHRVDGRTGSSLQELDPATLDAASVLVAALDEDPLAVSVVEHVAARLARIVATFASIYDPERVIIAGAVAESCEPLLELVRHELDRYVDPPGIEVLASDLGSDIVTVGAVKRALDHVREHALAIVPAALR